MGFFGKVFSGTMAVVLAMALVVYVSSLHALENQVHREAGARVERECKLVAKLVSRAWDDELGAGDLGFLADSTEALAGSRITLISSNGQVLFDSHEDPTVMDNHLERAELQAPGKLIERFSKTLQKEMSYIALPVEVGGELVAWARVAVSIQDRDARLADLNAVMRNGVLLAALIALILAAIIARQITSPLREIGEFVAAIGRGEATPRIRTNKSDEIGQLAGTVNTMAYELQEQITRIQRDKAEREAILSGISDSLIALDTENCLLFINAPARELLDVPQGRVKGLSIRELSESQELMALLADSSSTNESVQAEALFPSPEGELHIDLSAVPLPGEGGARRGTVLVMRDVTALRHLEAVRRDFVSNVSHELKTPLTAMRGYVEAVLDDDSMSKDQRATFLEKAQQNTERLSAIVTDLLSLSRLESAESELSFEKLELQEIVNEAIDDVSDLAESRQISIQTTHEGTVPIARADPQALRMALSNLISNAIYYTPAETGVVRVHLSSTPEEIHIDVIDNGPGIPASEQERIFERFYRVDKARSRKLGGTGLGLSIVRHVMSAHAGHVELESQPGKGSRFRLVLPRLA